MPLRWAPAGRLIGWEGQEAARRLGCTKLRIKPHPSRLSEMVSAIGRHYQLAEGHRQLGCRPACEMRLSRVGGRDDDIYLSELCRLPLPG